MRLFLVRHGETDWLVEGRLQGRSSVALNSTGRDQAQAAAHYLKSMKVRRLYTSELPRARETARFISETSLISSEEDIRLNEIFFGEWEGKPHHEIQHQYPELYRGWSELNMNFVAPGGESVQTVLERIRSFFAELRRFPETVVAVSHGGPIRLLLLELLGEPLHKFRALPVEPGSVTLVEKGSGAFRIVKIHVKTGAETSLSALLGGAISNAQ